MPDDLELVFRIDLRQPVGVRKPVRLRSREDPADPDQPGDFDRHRKGVARQHLHGDAELAKPVDQRDGVWPRGIVERDQADNPASPLDGTAGHCQRTVTLGSRCPDQRIEMPHRIRILAACFGNGPHRTFHDPEALPALFDHGFGTPSYGIERHEGELA